MDEAIEDGVGERRAADDLMPLLDRKLAGDDGRSALVTILEDFEEIALLRFGEDRQTPIVEDQELDARQGLEEATVTAIATGERKRLEQTWSTVVENAFSVPARLMTERAGNPALADAGRPGDQKPLGALDPIAGDELLEQSAVDAARRSHVDVLDDGVLAQGGELEARCEALGVAFGRLAIDHEAKPLLERQGGDVGRSPLVVEGLGHSRQAEGDEAFVGGVG